MSRDDIIYLRDIASGCRSIIEYTRGMGLPEFTRDRKTYDAVVRNLEVIAEAAKHAPEKLKPYLPDVEWRKLAGLRDMLACARFGIDDDILWDIVQHKTPELLASVEAFLKGA